MIKWFFKYGVVFLLFNTIFYSIDITKDFIALNIFYIIMASGLLFLLINPSQIKEVIFHKAFFFLLLLNIINLTYYLLFDDISNLKSLQYLMARFIQFALISFSVYHHQRYFQDKFFTHLIRIIILMVVIGIFMYPNIFVERYRGIIWNANMLASLTGIAFAVILLKDDKINVYNSILLVLMLIIAISTGSRLVLIAIVLSFFLKYSISLRNIGYSLLGLTVVSIVLFFNLNTSINRFATRDLVEDRTEQFAFAITNIKKNLWTGYGLDKYEGMTDEAIPSKYKNPVMSAHNGYLSIFIQYGILFGSIIIILFVVKSIFFIFLFRKEKGYISVYIFIIIYTLLAGLFESLFTGINEFQTILFWFSLSMLSYKKFNLDNEN